jgi:hypothetical protein
MDISSDRALLEKQIMEKRWKVDISKPGGLWVEDDEFEAFLDAWSDLASYYSSHADDTVIGVEVLREYVDFTRLLRRLVMNEEIDATRREKAMDDLEYLEARLEEIITEVVTYLDSIGQ